MQVTNESQQPQLFINYIEICTFFRMFLTHKMMLNQFSYLVCNTLFIDISSVISRNKQINKLLIIFLIAVSNVNKSLLTFLEIRAADQ